MKPNRIFLPAFSFCLIQLCLPGCVLLACLTRREFLPTNGWLLLVLYVAGTFLLLRHLKEGRTGAGVACLTGAMVNAAVMPLILGLPGCIGAMIGLVCGWMQLFRAPKSGWKFLWVVLAALPTLLLVPVIGLMLLFSGTGQTTVTQREDSPAGTYTALVQTEDHGALGGNTEVFCRDNTRTVPLLIGSLVDQRRLYRGQWWEDETLTLSWEQEDVLLVNGTTCPVAEAGCGDILQVAGELGISIREGIVLESCDSHGGFLGDGLTVVKIQGDISSMTGAGWHSLPLSLGAEKIPSYLSLPDTLPVNGMWYFCDRHSQRTDAYDPAPVMTRHSCNFTFALWDADTSTLTYYKIDT